MILKLQSSHKSKGFQGIQLIFVLLSQSCEFQNAEYLSHWALLNGCLLFSEAAIWQNQQCFDSQTNFTQGFFLRSYLHFLNYFVRFFGNRLILQNKLFHFIVWSLWRKFANNNDVCHMFGQSVEHIMLWLKHLCNKIFILPFEWYIS